MSGLENKNEPSFRRISSKMDPEINWLISVAKSDLIRSVFHKCDVRLTNSVNSMTEALTKQADENYLNFQTNLSIWGGRLG